MTFQNMICQSKTFQNAPSKNFHSVVKLMSGMEKKQVDTQKHFQTAKIFEKSEKGKNQSKYTQKYIELCKSWNWPATNIDELREILKVNCGKAEKIVQIDLSYYQDSHKADVVDFKRVTTF